MLPKTVTFYSNFLVLHQTPFCEAMVRLLGDGFTFVATESISAERLAMGYVDLNHSASYVLNAYETEKAHQKALAIGLSSDIVIIGSAPEEYVAERLRQNRPTFRYAERFFKQGRWKILHPMYLYKRYMLDIRHRKKNLYMLCSSAYTASDCRMICSYPKKTYRWGYFPPLRRYADIDALIARKKPGSILWVARLIALKHPEDAIETARQLRANGYAVTLDLIGDGKLRKAVETLIHQYGLGDCVHVLGYLSSEAVRERMEQADLFLFTSDRNEGWGAVMNESMNAACAVVANREIGSVPYLLRDGENGRIYDRKKRGDLVEKVKSLLDDPVAKRKMQKNAYRTVAELWNADVAAERLLKLCDCVTEQTPVPFTEGPCSPDFSI